MTNVSKKKLSEKMQKMLGEKLLEAMLRHKSKKDLEEILDGLLTKTEKVMLGKRLVAELLILSGWEVYDVASALKLSTATVYKFQVHLENNRGYAAALGRKFPGKIKPAKSRRQPSGLEKWLEDLYMGRVERGRLR